MVEDPCTLTSAAGMGEVDSSLGDDDDDRWTTMATETTTMGDGR